MRRAYDNADILVISSAVDNQPNVLIEASACGLPVVATAVGGIPDMAQDGVNALLVPPGDADALAVAVLRVARDPELASRLGHAAVENAQTYTWPRVRGQLAALYAQVLERTRDRRSSMADQPRTALVTGAAGFCGSYLTELFLAQGIHVVGVDQVGSGAQIGEYRLELLDLRDDSAVRRLVADVQPDWLVHLAALTNPAAPVSDLYAVNVFATIGLLDAVKELAPGCTVLIAGSSAQYGVTTPTENPISETQVFRPVTHYAVTKATQDLVGGMVSAAGLPLIRTRTFNIVGPRQSPAFVTAAFARQIAEIEHGQRAPVIEVGNLAAQRDFLDVRDVGARLLAGAGTRPAGPGLQRLLRDGAQHPGTAGRAAGALHGA